MTEEKHLIDKIYGLYEGFLPEKLRPYGAVMIMLFVWVLFLVFVGHEFGLTAALAIILFMGTLFGTIAIFILPGELMRKWKNRKR